MKTLLVMAISVLAQAAGNTLLSKGMKSIGSNPLFDGSFSPLMYLDALRDPGIWLGMLLLIVFFVGFAAALSWSDLSIVLPATAFGYVLNVMFASYFLDEPVSAARWAGSLLIVGGIVLVGRSQKKQEPSAAGAPQGSL